MGLLVKALTSWGQPNLAAVWVSIPGESVLNLYWIRDGNTMCYRDSSGLGMHRDGSGSASSVATLRGEHATIVAEGQ